MGRQRQLSFGVDQLELRIAPSITITTTCEKHPGPTDTEVTTGTNPAGKEPPGHQSEEELSNRECRHGAK